MYERSAIVLERYFEDLLDYAYECNVKDNYLNYCELVEKLEKYQTNYQKEYAANLDFTETLKKIKAIQLNQEKAYKKSAKLEYSRNLLFNNIENKVEDIRKAIEKIELDVEKNAEDQVALKEQFLSLIDEYNDKRFELSKCKRYKKMAENDYNEIYEKTRDNFDGITPDTISKIKSFSKYKNEDDIVEALEENGKDERIPFNEDVMINATRFGIEIAKKEAAIYLVVYDKMTKLLADIDNGSARIELHKKYLRNERAKIDFLMAAKNYLVQFLDYERMTVIHGRKSHNRLMAEACENFNNDIVQINNLYELLLKETTNKATKKAYKELYNKSYLSDIKQKEERFKKEKNRVNLNTATLINSNYWRIEGIRNIYQVFYYNVSDVFGRDVQEYDLPKDFSDDDIDSTVDDDIVNQDIEDTEPQEVIPFFVDDEAAEEKKPRKRGRPAKKKVEEDMPDTSIRARKEKEAYAQVEDDDDEEEDQEDIEEDEEEVEEDPQIVKYKAKRKPIVQDEDDDEDEDESRPFRLDDEDYDDDEEENEDEEDDYEEDYDGDEDEEEEEEESVFDSYGSSKINSYDDILNKGIKEFSSDSFDNDDFDIFGEKYKDVNFDIDVLPAKIKRQKVVDGDIEDEKKGFFEPITIDEEEEPIIPNNNFRPVEDLDDEIEDITIQEIPKKPSVFKKLRRANPPKNMKNNNDIW